MRGLMRMLMMFGPMIFRQYQKYQRNKSKQKLAQNADEQAGRGEQANENEKE